MAVMAEQGASGDHTVAASRADETVAAPQGDNTVYASPGGGQTVAVPNSTPTDSVELAWSGDVDARGNDLQAEEAQSEPATTRQSWRATWRMAGLLVVVGLVLAGAIFLGRWALTATNSPGKTAQPTQSAEPAPATTSKPDAATAAPASITSTPDQDNRYIQALSDKGISFANNADAIYNGKGICRDINRGVSRPEIIQALQANASFLGDKVYDYMNISIQTYCPQNGG
jgi:hypothetical protein